MLIADQLEEREGYVSFEGDKVKAQEFLEPSGVSAFGEEANYLNVADLPENVAFRILPEGQAVSENFEENMISVKPSSITYTVGQTYNIDFTQAMCVYDAGSEQPWGRYIFAEVEDSIQPFSNINSYSGSETTTDIGAGYLNWLILKYSNWKNALYNSIQAVTQHREIQWFLPSLEELKTGLKALGQWNDTFYLSSSKGALNLWGASVKGDDSDTLNRECHIKLFTTDKLINAQYKVGDVTQIDGVNALCVLDRLTETERYLFADMHGVAYYLKGIEDNWDENTSDTKSSYAWGTESTLVSLSTGIGSGSTNTQTALATDLVSQDTIWKAINDLNTERGSTAWFIPSLFECMSVYEQKTNIGNFPYGGMNAWLWTSSCANVSTAYSLSFYDGAQGQNAKTNLYHLRAVAFLSDSPISN